MVYVRLMTVFALAVALIDLKCFGCERSVEELIAQIASRNPKESAAAARLLGERKESSPAAIDALVESLGDDRPIDDVSLLIPAPRETVATCAADSLLAIGRPAVKRLAIAAERSRAKESRVAAMEILRRIGSDAEAAAPAVERILRDDTEDVRYAAVLTIAAIQKDDARLVQSLKSLLSNSSPHVRAAAVQPLGRLGPKAASAVSEVAKLLDDMEDRWHAYSPDAIGTRPVRYDAAMALAKMGRSARSTLPKLQEMTDKDPDSLVRIAAARAVAHLDDDRSHAIEVLIQHVDDPTGGRESIECAACALGELGAKARPAIPSLIRALKNSDTLVRISAARAYAAIDPSNATAVLLPLTQDSDRMVRASVIETIGHLRDESDAVWKVLIASLDDQGETFSYDVRHAAVVALGQLGKKGVSALPRLQKLAEEDESEWVREAAKDAIQKIRQGK